MTRLPEAVLMVLATANHAKEGCAHSAAIARDKDDARESREEMQRDIAERTK